MRYFSYDEYVEEIFKDSMCTISEEDIRQNYYPIWYDKMCKRHGKKKVDEIYNFEDCLADWMIEYWGWESNQNGK